MSRTQLDPIQSSAEARDLSQAVGRELRTPLNALRHVLLGLRSTLQTGPADEGAPEGTSACGLVERALDEVARVEHGVETLIDLCAPPALHPLHCSLRELARGAWEALPSPRRERVLLAQELEAEHVHVDGPHFERCLATLVHEATDQPQQEILLHAHAQDGEACIAIIGGKDDEPSLDAEVACRELQRMGATLDTVHGSQRCRFVRLPLAPVGGAA